MCVIFEKEKKNYTKPMTNDSGQGFSYWGMGRVLPLAKNVLIPPPTRTNPPVGSPQPNFYSLPTKGSFPPQNNSFHVITQSKLHF